MSERVVYLNGRFVPEAEAKVSIYDMGLVTGEMAFEVTRTFRHRPFHLADHLRRLYATLAAIDADPGMAPEELERRTLETLERNLPTEAEDVDWQIIHNVSPGPAGEFRDAFAEEELRPTVAISCYPLKARLAAMAGAFERGLDLVVPPQRALPGELLDPRLKTRSRLHYQLAAQQARRENAAAVAVLVDPEGYLTECSNGNLFVVRGGKLQTPAEGNLLPGITRGVVLGLAGRLGIEASEVRITEEEGRAAEEAFITGTSIGIVHARSLDGAAIGDGRRGPVTSRLREAFYEEVGVDIAEQAHMWAQG